MLTGEPLFPGDSDIDQLYHIVKCFGNLTPRHREVFLRNPLFVGMRIPEVREIQPLERKFTKVSSDALDFMKVSVLSFTYLIHLHLSSNNNLILSFLSM